jgi:hypothetical protein
MNTEDNLPQSIAEEILQVLPDLYLKVDVLDDGRRVIRQEDMNKFYEYLEKC